jgi:DNA-binding CsgD family transcriptional regulator
MVLLEREQELETLRAALAEVRSGTGCAVAIEAGAGLGKTRLLQEVRRIGGEGDLNVLSGRATELESDFPFALVRQLFESQLTALSAQKRRAILEGATAAGAALGVDPSGRETDDPFAVLHGLYWVTAALGERQPLLLAIDDAHWADAGSLDYLGFLLPRLEELPVLLVVTVRPDEPESSPSLGRILTDPIVRHLTPAPLSPEATNTLLAQRLEREPDSTFAAVCHTVSGGNPFLLSELAHNLLEQGIEPTAEHAEVVREQAPEQVARIVLTRIAKLPPEAAAVARSLAVLGDDSDLALLAEMDGANLEATQRAVDELHASAIFNAGSSPAFVHPLVRNAIYSDMSVGERSRAHARAAAILRERGVGLERIATQLLATQGRGERVTVEALLEAGEQALGAGAPRSAIAYLTRALGEPPPPDLRTAVLDPLLTASFRAADQPAFAAIEDDVFAEWRRDPTVRSRWASQLTMLMALGGRFEEAASMLREAVEVAVAEGDIQRAFQLEAQLSTIARLGPSVREVDLSRYTDRIDPSSPGGRLAAAMEVRSAVMKGNAAEAVDAAKRALGDGGVIFAEDSEPAAAVIAVLTLLVADEVDAARDVTTHTLALARERGATPELVRAWFLNAMVAWCYGDLTTAEADLRQAIDLARLAGIMPLVLLFTPGLVEILVERDELDAAEGELRAIGMAAGSVPENVMFNMLLMLRGHLRLEQGKFEQALEDFEALSTQTRKMGVGPGATAMAVPWTARALVALGRQAQARELADSMRRVGEQWGAPSLMAQTMRGVATARGGVEAIQLLEKAAGLLEQSPRRLERVHVLVDLGEALRREGRRVEARSPLRDGYELARRCGAARLAKRANVALQATGVTVRRYAPIGVESLTPSERRVAELAASGLTNRQIAQSLFVTRKTVEAHLSAAYDKLDIGSRRELPGALDDADEATA